MSPLEYNSEGIKLDLSWEPIQFNPADFTASSGAWTVEPVDVTVWQYALVGNNMCLLELVVTTTVITGNPAALYVRTPFTPTRPYFVGGGVGNPGGALAALWMTPADADLSTRRCQIRAFSVNFAGLTDLGFQLWMTV